MIVLVTGANGQVGRHALLEYASGEKVNHIIATDITPNFWTPPDGFQCSFEYVRADLRNKDDLTKLTEVILRRPENEVLILDIGALFRYSASRKDLFECNVLGQKNLVETVALPLQDRGKDVKTVFWSAGAVYGNFDRTEFLPATEDYPLDAQNDYAQSKIEAERWLLHYHQEYGFWITIMRCGAIYGEWSNYGMANAFILQILGLLEPLIMGTKENDYGRKSHAAMIHARDTVRIADFLAECSDANGTIYNVRDHANRTTEEVTRAQAEACGVKALRGFRMRYEDFDRFIVKKVERKAKAAGVEPLVDTGLAAMMALNANMSIDRLLSEFKKKGVDFTSYLLYPDALLGIREVIGWFKTIGRKEGYLNV